MSGDAEVDVKNGLALDLSARYMPKQSWGFIAGLTYDFKREFDGGELTLEGQKFIFDEGGDNDEIQVTVIYANAVYRWNEFYLPFGLNYSFVDYEAVGGGVDADGGIGAQLGIGYMLSDNFALELMSRATTLELGAKGGGYSIKFKEGMLTSALLIAKYIF